MAACALIASLAASKARADVQYFDQVPSTDALRSALMPPAVPDRHGHAHVRGIDWSVRRAPVAPGQAKAETPKAARASTPAAGEATVAMPITFAAASARITSAGMPFVAAIAEVLARDPGLHLQVEGHTDASGDAGRNLLLSWDRALGVVRLLAERYGIDPSRLQPVGKGASEPLDDTAPQDARNRRVQFRVAQGKEV